MSGCMLSTTQDLALYRIDEEELVPSVSRVMGMDSFNDCAHYQRNWCPMLAVL